MHHLCDIKVPIEVVAMWFEFTEVNHTNRNTKIQFRWEWDEWRGRLINSIYDKNSMGRELIFTPDFFIDIIVSNAHAYSLVLMLCTPLHWRFIMVDRFMLNCFRSTCFTRIKSCWIVSSCKRKSLIGVHIALAL